MLLRWSFIFYSAQGLLRELSSICETEGVYRSTTLPTSAGEVGTTPSTARSVLRLTVKVTLRPAAKSG